MDWVILIIAAIFEISWTGTIKSTEGFTKLWPSVATIGLMSLSVYLLGIATKTLPLGTAYAVWTGIGAIGAVILGIIIYKDPINTARIFFLMLIFCGIIGLKITSN